MVPSAINANRARFTLELANNVIELVKDFEHDLWNASSLGIDRARNGFRARDTHIELVFPEKKTRSDDEFLFLSNRARINVVELYIHFHHYYESTTNSRVRFVAIELEKNRVRYQLVVLDDGPTSDLKSSLVVLELDNQVFWRGEGWLPYYALSSSIFFSSSIEFE